MAQEQNIHRLETPGSLYLNRFWSGLVTNRSALFTPLTALGIQMIQRQDSLIGGANMQITPEFTLRRRFGFLKASSSAFGSSEWPLGFFSFQNLSGTVTPIVDTQVGVYDFTATTKSALFTKAAGAVQSSFNSVANTMYWCDGVSAMKFIGPNLLIQSNTFTNAAWTKGSAVTLTGGQTDPLGGTAATRVACSASAGNEFLYNVVTPNYTPVASNTFTVSVWLKSVSGGTSVDVNLVNQGVVSVAVVTEAITGTWTRYQVTGAMGGGDSQVGIYIVPHGGAVASTFLVYGAQLEANGTATDLQITTTQPQGVYLMGITAPTVAAAISTTSGSLSPTVGFEYVYCFFNPLTGHISTASPVSASTGPLTSKNINLSGNRSTDPQATQIQIFRTKDGGGGTYFFLAQIANPGAGTWSYTDSTPDASLNTLLIAPLAHVNDPPPTGMSLITWFAGRLWCAVGNTLFFSGGPDTIIGVGQEAWPPGNNFTVPGNITALAATSQGLVIFTRDDAWVTTGTSSSNFTVPQLWQANFGVASQNAVFADGDTLFIFTTRGQAWSYSNSGLVQIGYNIAPNLAAFNPASVYLTVHANGADEGVFISDGSANIYRYSQVSQSWDTVMQPVGGCGAITSMEMANGAWSLLMGRNTGSKFILQRDGSGSTWTDDGSAFTCSVIVGSLTVAPPRQTATIKSVLIQATATGTYPTVSVMLNEIADLSSLPATFTALPNPVADPWELPLSLSLWTKRHDLKAAAVPLPQLVQHMQVKVAFVAEAFGGELLGLGLD